MFDSKGMYEAGTELAFSIDKHRLASVTRDARVKIFTYLGERGSAPS